MIQYLMKYISTISGQTLLDENNLRHENKWAVSIVIK